MNIPYKYTASVIVALATLVATGSLQAANNTWTGAAGSPFDWSTPGNWTIPLATDNTAVFGTAGGTNLSPNLDSNRSITGLSFTGTGYTLGSTAGGFTLTGAAGGTIAGSGTDALNTINNLTYAFNLAANGNNVILSNGSDLTFGSTSTMNFNGIGNFTSTLNIGDGSVLTTNGAIVANAVVGASINTRINKGGLGKWIVNSANNDLSNLNRVALASGTIELGASGALGTADIVKSGATDAAILMTTAGTTTANKIQFLNSTGATTSQTIGGTNTSGTATFSNSVDLSFASSGVTTGEKLTQFTAASGGRVTFSGTIKDNSSSEFRQGGVNKVGGGTVVFTGVTNTYTLGTVVSEGTLLINATPVGGSGVGTGNLTVASGATLGGASGRVKLAADNSININGTIDVGDGSGAAIMFFDTSGAGAFNLNAGSTISLDIWTNTLTGVDRIVTQNTTNVILDDTSTLSVANAGAVTFASGDTFNLFDWANTPTGTFGTVLLPTLTGGLTWDTSDIYNTGTISVVPEPSSVLLCGLGLAMTLHCLRRRNRVG